MINREKILGRLENTGVPIEEETATPIAGETVPLPYLIIRSEETDTWDDMGRVCVTSITWTITLFTVNKDFALECKIRKALAGLGTVAVERFPDSEPYSVDFSFTKKGALQHEQQ